MAKFSYGEEKWEGANDGKTVFAKMETGRNICRVVSQPFKTSGIHWAQPVDSISGGKPRKVRCSGPDTCPVCKKVENEMPELEAAGKTQHKEARKPRWIFALLNRKDGEVKLLEAGPQIVNGIRTLSDKPELGSPDGYDIDITVNPQSRKDYYTVSAVPNSSGQMIYPLTSEEKENVKEFMASVDIQAMIVPDTPEQIRKILGWVKEGDSEGSKDVEEKVSSDTDDVDNNFNSDADNKSDDEDFLNFD